MTSSARFLLSIGVMAAALMSARPALAHVKWFEERSEHPLAWDLLFRPLPLAIIGAALLLALAAGLLWRRRGRGFVPGPEAFGAADERRSIIYSLAPLILGFHVAVPLLVNGVQGRLFSPDNPLPGAWANFLGFTETFVALALFYGAFTRIAAIVLAGLWCAGLFLVGLESMLDNVLFLGFAAFFLLVGRGPVSVDRMLLPVLEPPEWTVRYAITPLRIGLGLSFIFVAFSEKFANIPLAEALVERRDLNVTGALGVPLPDDVFILLAGSVELTVGLFLLLGVFVREVVLILLLPVNLTLTLFDWTELIGHLPIYGIIALLLIWEPGRKNLMLWMRGIREKPLALASASGTAEPDRND